MKRRAPSAAGNARGAWRAFGGCLLALVANNALADEAPVYPNRPIRMVVAFAAGTQMDAVARLVGARLAQNLRQPVVIDNRAGASGNIASDVVAKAAPDGHTLLVNGVNMTIQPSIAGTRAVDPVRAFAPVTKLVTQPVAILANPGLAVKSLADLVALARSKPGGLSFATGGVGTSPHLCAEMLGARASMSMVHVPYPNAAQGVRDTISGTVPINFTVLSAGAPFMRNGQLTPLAVTSRQRVPAFPQVPTVAESGYPGFESASWYGLFAPAATPGELIERLHRNIVSILALPEVRESLSGMGVEIVGNRPEQFAAEIRVEVAQWPEIIKAAGIAAE